MVKIGDIARATGYSTTTVSKAFNNYTDISDKARNAIRRKAEEMGYVPNTQARGLVMKRSFTIGIILDEMLGLGLTHPFFGGVVQAFREVVEEKGYSLVLISNTMGNYKGNSYLTHCHQINVDGVFILCTNKDDLRIQELLQSKIPTVLFDTPDDDTHGVISSHYEGAKAAVNYLIGLGHKKIGHIYGNELTFAGSERKRGFYDTMKAHGFLVNENYVKCGGYFDFHYGKNAMNEVIRSGDLPTAMFIAGDIMALGAIQACYEHNIRIPDDLSIVGFDNVKLLDWITPGLTSIAQDYKGIARACCDIILASIDKKDIAYRKEIISTYIIERNSCISLNESNSQKFMEVKNEL
jgi:LacI family transcriptional regulator